MLCIGLWLGLVIVLGTGYSFRVDLWLVFLLLFWIGIALW